MKTPEEILTNHFGSSQVDGYRANIIDAMLYYASQQLKTQADNHRKDMAMKLDLLRQQHEVEMVEFAEYLLQNTYMNGTISYMTMDLESQGRPISISDLLAQFRSNNGGQG